MSFAIISQERKDDWIQFNIDAWPRLLQLAEAHGWEPIGTQPGAPFYLDCEGRDSAEWDGSYRVNGGQIVTTEDSAALADALERILDDLPDDEVKDKIVDLAGKDPGNSVMGQLAKMLGPEAVVYGANPDMHPFEYFGGVMKKKVVDFIRLCREGAFEIW